MIDDGIPICSSSEPPTMSPTISIDGILAQTDAPTLGSPNELAESDKTNTTDFARGTFYSMFRTREHESDTDSSSNEEDDESNGRRHLMAMSYGNPSLVSFDPISVSDNLKNPAASSLLQSLSRGEVSDVGQSQLDETVSTSCPTWGPSVVPRRFDERTLIDYFNFEENRKHNNITEPDRVKDKPAQHPAPGRARYIQHQINQLDPMASLSSKSVVLPPEAEAKKRRVLVTYGEEELEFRLYFDTAVLTSLLRAKGHNFASKDEFNPLHTRISALVDTVLPSVVETWGSILRINRPTHNIFPHDPTCSTTPIPSQHINEGVTGADTVLYIESREAASCESDLRPKIIVCHFDQHMRPLVGSLSLCLDDVVILNGEISQMEMSRQAALLSQLVGRFLGLSPNLFKYFRNPETDQLWGEREVEVTCSDGDDSTLQSLPLSNIIRQKMGNEGERFYEISTPTLIQVVRNHFDCQSLTGARLDAPAMDPINHHCSFFDLDLRFHFDEDITSISQNADAAYGISPLSLALLEDSSWYTANFVNARTTSFGRGAGCGFFESKCISSGKLPDYSTDYFCTTADAAGTRSGCDYLHHHKAGCDGEMDVDPPEQFQYFTDAGFGSPFGDVHYCPMRTKYLIPCSAASKAVTPLAGESFSDTSRCYETDAGIPVCLETVCNAADKSLSFNVKGKTYHCSYHEQIINVGSGYSIKCPRIAAICPDMICPANCSGKGVCDYCKEVPVCLCDNPLDQSDGCWIAKQE